MSQLVMGLQLRKRLDKQMSKIDVSVEEDKYNTFVVIHGKNTHGYFSTRLGAEEWMKMLIEEISQQEQKVNCV